MYKEINSLMYALNYLVLCLKTWAFFRAFSFSLSMRSSLSSLSFSVMDRFPPALATCSGVCQGKGNGNIQGRAKHWFHFYMHLFPFLLEQTKLHLYFSVHYMDKSTTQILAVFDLGILCWYKKHAWPSEHSGWPKIWLKQTRTKVNG